MKESDGKLVEAAIKGNQEAYGELVRNYTGFVYTMAYRMTGDHHHSEDLCQDVFLKGWLKLSNLKESKAFPGWISTIARRTCLNALDKRNRKMELGEEEAVLVNLNPTMPSSWDQSRCILETAIAQLSPQDREVITLCYFQELNSAEVAEVMGIPSGTVRVYLHRARLKLKELLEGSQDELLG